MRNDLTKVDLKWLVPTIIVLFMLLLGEVLPEHRNDVRFGLKVAGGLAVCVAVFFFTRSFRGPFGYRSLHCCKDFLVYEDLSKSRHQVRWSDISRVRFIRREALFDDVDGPYVESLWLIDTALGVKLELVSESANRSMLVRAFRRRLMGFNTSTAKSALSAAEEGEWVCFERQRGHALQETIEDSRA